MSKDLLASYLAGRAITSPWRLEGDTAAGLSGCVVIPALAESERLFATLGSLAENPAPLLARFLVVVVVNHREDAPQGEKLDNEATLSRLRLLDTPLRLAYVDAARAGRELPAGSGGVGMARKIGLDLALPHLSADGVMVSLDADTLVEPGYLQAISSHFAGCRAGGAVIPFCHQPGANPAERRAIMLYELFLRHYVAGLRRAGSPYAFHCVGSAMACSAQAYLRMGGMNSRCAGEDFYFLQQLERTSGIAQVAGTTVHPSARSSHRVPFGTGRSISRILSEGEEAQTFYRIDCFRVLGEWLALAERGTGLTARELLERSEALHPQLRPYLAQAGFDLVWERLRGNSRGPEALRRAFHCWFDGLKTLRLVHHLSLSHPRCTAGEAIPDLLRFCGLAPVRGEEAQLSLLRAMQNHNAE